MADSIQFPTEQQEMRRGSVGLTAEFVSKITNLEREIERLHAIESGRNDVVGDSYYGHNIIKNSPGEIPVDGAEPQWWDEGDANATLTDEDTAGEAPPDIHERCFKCVTIANDKYGLQTLTLADEELLDAGVTVVSLGCWVYCATGSKASVGIFGTNLTLQESSQASAGAWEWLTVENVTLDAGDATIEIRLIVDTDTAWFTMPMFSVGPLAQPWVQRGVRYMPRVESAILDKTGQDQAWTDLDASGATDANAVAVQLLLSTLEPNGTVGSAVAVGHSDNVTGADSLTIQVNILVVNGIFHFNAGGPVRCDDAQLIRYIVAEVDNDGDVRFVVSVQGWWEWQ